MCPVTGWSGSVNFCFDFQLDFRLLMDVNESINSECSECHRDYNLYAECMISHVTFLTDPLIHIHQKAKIRVEIITKIENL